MAEVLKIFISATTADLGPVRLAAWEFFSRHDQYKPFIQEYRDSVPATLLENDQHHLKECDLVLHIVGECYGTEPAVGAAPSAGGGGAEPGAELSAGGGGAEPGARRAVVAGVGGARRSYTQREYDYAIEHGKPLYIFVCEEHFPYAEHEREPEEKQALQRAHRKAILKGEIKYWKIADLDGLDAALREIKLDSQRLAAELRDTRRSFEEVGRDVAGLRAGITAIDPLQRYYQNLREQFANYDNVGLPVTAREGKEEKEEPIKIRDLFVPPHCSEQHIKPAELDNTLREGKTLGQPLLPLLEKPGARIVLLADPGMGKSTVIQLLIATLADDAAPAGAPGLRGAIPFPFILRELARLLPDDVMTWNWNALLDAFRRWDPRGTGDPALAAPLVNDEALFRTLNGSEDAFFLIDGLDEIGDLVKRVAVRNAVWEGFKRHPKARWLISSRIVGYDRAEVHESETKTLDMEAINREVAQRGALEAYVRHDLLKAGRSCFLLWAHLLYLAPFNDAQQRAFAEHWYVPRMSEPKGAQRAGEFIAAVHQHPHTRVIGRIPNLLYLLALLYRHQAHLPNGRALVYEAISQAYLESIPQQRRLLREAGAFAQSLPEKEQLLAIVGMKMQQMRASRQGREDGDILVSREQLTEWLGPRFASVADLDDFLHHVARHSGLLLPRGEGVYGFAHLSFQEYYAACHLQSDFSRIVTAKARPAGGFLRRAAAETVENEERLFAEYAQLPVWHEPLLFLVEKFRASPAYTTQLLEWMFPQFADDPAKSTEWMPLPAAQLLATLSIDSEIALDLEQRGALWQALWRAQCASDWQWRIAPSLMVAGSAFKSGVLHAADLIKPQRLDLNGCTGLDDLTPLAGLTGLHWLHLSGCTGLGDLAALAGLTGLQTLHLDGCTGLRDLVPLAGLTGLQWLNLSGCTGLSDLTPLAGLTGLRSLNLSGCTGLCDLTLLAELTGLHKLHLSGCTALRNLAALAELTGLETLDLSGCTALRNLATLAGLTGLQELYLGGCTGLGDFTPLAGLTGLRSLNVLGCTGLGDLTPLAGLTGLQSLSLGGGTGLGDLTPLAGLTGLQSLSLVGMELGDLTPLAGLTGLKSLYVGECTGLRKKELANLRKAVPRAKILF